MTPLPRLLALGAFLPVLLLAAPKPADSAHYRTVRDRVGDGGQVFVYVDVDGYFTELGRELTTSMAAAAGDDASLALWKQDYAAVFAELGLAQVKAVGLSSRPLAPDRFANRIYLHVPEGRRGLLQFFGGAAHPFDSAQLAPADTDLFVETELDLSALCTTSLQLLQRISPELAAQFPGQVPSADEMSGLAVLTSLTQFKGRFTAVVRLHGETAFGPESEFPHDVLIGTDAHGPQFLALLRMRQPELKAVKTEGARTFYSTGEKLPGLPAPLCLVAEGERLHVATSEAFLRECLDRKAGLAQAPAFKQALAATADEGNSVVFATPRLFATVREAVTMVSKLTMPDRVGQSSYRFFLDRLARVTAPVVSVTSNLPDGVLVQSVGPDSLRESLPVLGLLTPDLAGNILRIALPAHVAKQYAARVAERQAVPVRENLARISAVATAYFAKNAESEEVAFADLLALDPALADLKPIEDEDYSIVTIRRARDAVEVATPELGTVTYARPLTDDEKARIERNLALYDEAASLYFAAKPDESTMSAYEATGAGGQLTETPASVVGEEYDFQVERDATTIEVRTPGGTIVSHTRTPGLRWTALKRRAQQTAAIRENLAILYSVATDYLGQHPDESYVSGSELFGEGEDKPRPALRSVAGEDYDEVRVTRTRAGATISVPHLGEVSFEAPLPVDEVAAIQANLRTIATAAKTYFEKHPQERLVVVGELVGEGQPLAAAPTAVRGEDYLPLVLERGAKTLSLTLPTTQSVTIDLP